MRFFLIDRITAFEVGRHARATKAVALSEDVFEDHFPLRPVMPGALIIEGMAQLAGLLLAEGQRRETGRPLKALMTIIQQAKFRRPVRPGDTLEYRATAESTNELGGVATVEALVGEERVAEARLVFSFVEITDPQLEAWRNRVVAQWMSGLTPPGG